MPEHTISINRRGIRDLTTTRLSSDKPEDFETVLKATLTANSYFRSAQQIRQEDSPDRTILEEKGMSHLRTVFEEKTALELGHLALHGENGTERITEKSGDLYRIKEAQV